MDKEIVYTTTQEQINKLSDQQLYIPDIDRAKHSLQLYGYSNLVKSYREPYVIRNNDTIVYRSGVSFDQICSLYILDKNLRNAVMAAMQDLEEHIKESAASVIAESFGTDETAYLNFRNYSNKTKRKKQFCLSSILETCKKTLDTDKNPICHYKSKYGNVPPWILFKSIYFSTIINFIDQFKVKQKNTLIEKLYDTSKMNLTEGQLRMLLSDTLSICLEYRNTAAHGGRIYNHKTKTKLRSSEIFGKDTSAEGYSQLLSLLELFNYKSPYKRLDQALTNELQRHIAQFPQDTTYLGQILNIDIVQTEITYINNKSNKYHRIPHCSGVIDAKQISLEEAIGLGYIPCKKCNIKN